MDLSWYQQSSVNLHTKTGQDTLMIFVSDTWSRIHNKNFEKRKFQNSKKSTKLEIVGTLFSFQSTYNQYLVRFMRNDCHSGKLMRGTKNILKNVKIRQNFIKSKNWAGCNIMSLQRTRVWKFCTIILVSLNNWPRNHNKSFEKIS